MKVIVDGIPATLPDGQSSLNHVDPGAIDRVELVRGPASALWGNAAGGVLLLETAPPTRVSSPRLPSSSETVTASAGSPRPYRSVIAL